MATLPSRVPSWPRYHPVYLHGHVTGWLEPLMDRIGRDPRTVPTPVIDVIDDDTLQFFYQDSTLSVGGFDWSLQVHHLRWRTRLIHVFLT